MSTGIQTLINADEKWAIKIDKTEISERNDNK